MSGSTYGAGDPYGPTPPSDANQSAGGHYGENPAGRGPRNDGLSNEDPYDSLNDKSLYDPLTVKRTGLSAGSGLAADPYGLSPYPAAKPKVRQLDDVSSGISGFDPFDAKSVLAPPLGRSLLPATASGGGAKRKSIRASQRHPLRPRQSIAFTSGSRWSRSIASAFVGRPVWRRLVAHELEPVDVDQPPVRDLEMRDHRQRQEGDLQERFCERHAEALGRRAQRDQPLAHVLEAGQAHQPGDGERQFGDDLAAFGHREAPLDLAQPVDRGGHVRFVRSDDAEVVAVVADGRGDGAPLHAEALHEGGRHIVVDAVARDDRDLDDVLIEIDLPLAVPVRQRHRNALGDDLAGNDADRLGRRPLPARREIIWLRRGAPSRFRARRRQRAARGEQRVVDHAAARQNHRDGAVLEIVDDGEIGAPARRDEPAIAQAEDARGRNRRGAIGGERRRAEPDRGADEEIEMAFLGDVERIAVVGAEGDEGRIALGDDGASACRSLDTEPSRISTCMPLESFSRASGRLVTS